VQFEFENISNSNNISNLYSNICKTLTSNLGLILKAQPAYPATDPAQLHRTAAHQPLPLLIFPFSQ
jgi:hypothetical protein